MLVQRKMGIQIEGSIVFPTPYPEADGEESLAVANFRRYLRIRTVHPKPDYRSCSVFLRGLAEEIGLDFKEIECVQGKPISILTWKGTDPSLPSIMLNSHTDVVPVFEESWLHDPFSADRVVNSEGETVIIARGSQDMKIVGILYLEAIRELKKSYPQPLRTVHMSFVPDEEIDGSDGMKEFIKTDLFKELNVGLALDEGISNEGGFYRVFYGERSPWKVRYTTTGNTGHGSQFIGDLATDKLFRIAKKLRDFRFTQELILVDNPERTLGDVTTINLTQLQSGVQFNVVPKTAAFLTFGFPPMSTFKSSRPLSRALLQKKAPTLNSYHILKEESIPQYPMTFLGGVRSRRDLQTAAKSLSLRFSLLQLTQDIFARLDFLHMA
ncbi:adenylate cyclase, variant 3 [Entomophthora muscae]|uniref:Adenylate cyclase, variant 3 n=1 Tax=Entomophthora muscae TaxID=34485 RepID=A0ACC2S934_9FUNG|nr:adenylate cyclase, variant 3 [Entomophthora muscae]